MHNHTTRQLLITHYNTYPKMEIRDIFKFLFQSSFGCEHFVSSEERALEYIQRELETVTDTDKWQTDTLDGNYTRVHLSALNERLTPEILAKFFCMSARKEPHGEQTLVEKLHITRELIKEGSLPFSLSDFDELHAEWQKAGYPAIHHSDKFRDEYKPAYRVIANEYLDNIHQTAKSKDRA